MSYVKQCSKCNEIKEINEFYKKVSSKDGYTGVCKKCITENNKKYKMTCSICGKEYKTHKKIVYIVLYNVRVKVIKIEKKLFVTIAEN